MSKDKKEAKERREERHNHHKIKSHTRQIGDPQNLRTILPQKFSHCCEDSQLHVRLPSLGNLIKGLGIPRKSDLESQWDLIIGVPQDWGKQRLQSWRAQTKSCVHQDPEEWPHRGLNQTYLLVLEGLLWRCGSAGAHHRDMALVAAVWEGPPWHKPFWRSPLTLL